MFYWPGYSRKKKKKKHRYSRRDFRFIEFQARRDQLFFQLSLISESKSGSWLIENRQNSHWYRPQAVIYIGCEYNGTQWPTNLFMLIGKIFPNEQFLMDHNVMFWSVGIVPALVKVKGMAHSLASCADVLSVWFSLLFKWEWQWLLPTQVKALRLFQL